MYFLRMGERSQDTFYRGTVGDAMRRNCRCFNASTYCIL